MNEVYSAVLPAAPYVVGAYTLIWLTVIVYIALTMRRVKGLERELDVLEEALERRQAQ